MMLNYMDYSGGYDSIPPPRSAASGTNIIRQNSQQQQQQQQNKYKNNSSIDVRAPSNKVKAVVNTTNVVGIYKK